MPSLKANEDKNKSKSLRIRVKEKLRLPVDKIILLVYLSLILFTLFQVNFYMHLRRFKRLM